jgi:hypothetical protein
MKPDTMTAADFRASITPKRNKYGAIPTLVDGIRFASKAEARRYSELLLLQRGGEITGLQLQPKYPLFVNGTKIGVYTGDFSYFDKTGAAVVEDVKSKATGDNTAYRLRKKLAEALYGIVIQEVGL